MKKFLLLLASLFLVLSITNCTSKDTENGDGEEVVEESTEESTGDGSEEAVAEDGSVEEEKSSAVAEEGASEDFGDEELPADGEASQVAEEGQPASEQAPSDTAGVDLGASPTETLPQESQAEVVNPTETAMGTTEETTTPTELSSTELPAEPKPVASLRKVEAAPFKRGGQLLNAVYVARPGDDFTSISQMIYGTADKAADLQNANAWITTVKPGHKIYYNSPDRPDDNTKLLSYYEEKGIPSEVYTAQAGDNIRKVSEQLLGYPNAWQEIWSLNADLESKGELAEGTQLRYWKTAMAGQPSQQAPVNEVAANLPPPPQEMPEMAPPPPPPMEAMAPPPPPPEMAPPAELPPPPPMEAMAPPPPQPAPAAEITEPVGEEGMDNDMMMNVGGAVIAAAALGAFIMIKRKKAREKEMQQAFDATQVG